MTTISAVSNTEFAPQPKRMPTREEINQRKLEQAIIIAKTKPENERNWEDYLALAADAFQKIMTPQVCYNNENANVNYLA